MEKRFTINPTTKGKNHQAIIDTRAAHSWEADMCVVYESSGVTTQVIEDALNMRNELLNLPTAVSKKSIQSTINKYKSPHRR